MVAGDAGVVDKDVQPSVRFVNGLDTLRRPRQVGDIQLATLRPAAGVVDLGDYLCGVQHIGTHYGRPAARQPPGDLGADPTRPTGHHRYLPVELTHRPLLDQSSSESVSTPYLTTETQRAQSRHGGFHSRLAMFSIRHRNRLFSEAP